MENPLQPHHGAFNGRPITQMNSNQYNYGHPSNQAGQYYAEQNPYHAPHGTHVPVQQPMSVPGQQDPNHLQPTYPPSSSLTMERTHSDSYSASGETATRNQTLASTTSSSSSKKLLNKPIAIPATSAKIGSPFMRAYPSCLEALQIDKNMFLSLIDKLNRVAVASPPLQVLGLAGNIVSNVPLHTAQIVGGSIAAATAIGTTVASQAGTAIFLKEVNRDIFGPRGLKMEVAKLDVVAKISGMPILNEKGKIDKKVPLLEPVHDINKISELTGQQRRLQTLEPYIAHLDLEPLPDIGESSNFLGNWHTKASEKQRQKEEKKMMKTRIEAHEEHIEETAKVNKEFSKEMKKLEKEEAKAHKKGLKEPRKGREEMRKVEEKRQEVVEKHEKEIRKTNKDLVKDDKEQKGMRKILWVVIRDADSDGPDGPPTVDYTSDSS